MEKIGTTCNFTPCSKQESLPTWAFEDNKPYVFNSKQAEFFYKLFEWETMKPCSLEEFKQWKFSVRSCSWTQDGQAIMLEPFGTRTRHDCLQLSVDEFLEHLTPYSEVEQQAAKYAKKVTGVFLEAA